MNSSRFTRPATEYPTTERESAASLMSLTALTQTRDTRSTIQCGSRDKPDGFAWGGTSAAAPQWSALIAIANSMRAATRKSPLSSTNGDSYTLAKSRIGVYFHAVTNGTNGSCGAVCDAGPGYDFVTGLGSPQAAKLIAALVAQR